MLNCLYLKKLKKLIGCRYVGISFNFKKNPENSNNGKLHIGIKNIPNCKETIFNCYILILNNKRIIIYMVQAKEK